MSLASKFQKLEDAYRSGNALFITYNFNRGIRKHMAKIFVRTTAEERVWEKRHILSQTSRYLASNVLEKIKVDDGYRIKVETVEKKLGTCTGYILDIGSNTAGECEYLVTKGYLLIATDINEYALGLSKKRCKIFLRPSPDYAACDAANLPFSSDSIDHVVFNESLHHIPEPQMAINEAARVLKPGGKLIMFEPYAYDPWRRLSEIRDYFKGTIETSFTETQVRNFLKVAGLNLTSLTRPVLPPSRTKLNSLPIYHRLIRTLYSQVKERFPAWLGMILCEAEKPGTLQMGGSISSFESLLVCPKTKAHVALVSDRFISVGRNTGFAYPVVDGIPVLIASEAYSISDAEWVAAIQHSEIIGV